MKWEQEYLLRNGVSIFIDVSFFKTEQHCHFLLVTNGLYTCLALKSIAELHLTMSYGRDFLRDIWNTVNVHTIPGTKMSLLSDDT